MTRVLVGVSSCLLGETVRWDGGHREHAWVRGVLARHVTLVPVCPEWEAGMGVPREPVHLEGPLDAPRMVGNHSGDDGTERMRAWSRARLAQLARLGLDGHVLKHGSPSCGARGVPVTDARGVARAAGTGLFAAALRRRLPLLPVVEEGDLADAAGREHFAVRVFAHHRLRRSLARRPGRRRLVDFHAREELLVRAHDPRRYRELGRLVAAAGGTPPAACAASYRELYMAALSRPATPGRHADVLQHVLRHLEQQLSPAQKADALAQIEAFRRGEAPLLAPLALLAHHLRVHGVAHVLAQSYLQPAPAELAPRGHA